VTDFLLISDASGTPRKMSASESDGLFTPHQVSQNISTKFRDAFESFSPERWTAVATGTGDIVQVDGNAASASYLVLSKSPWNAGTETILETVGTFTLPIELAFGLSMSQRTVGQEFSIELVDTDAPLADIPDLAIASITQTTTTLTVDTVTPHGLTPGKSIGIRDCSNPLVNYPAVVVATIPSPTQFTVTAGPIGNIPSQTVTNPAGAKGFVYFRERFGRANNGVAQIFENTTVTQASLYTRSESGDALPSGTIAGNHSVTVGTTASVQLVNAPNTYAFAPTTEYRINVQSDRTQWYDSAVDALTQASNRGLRTQVCPDPSATYRLRLRATNNKSLTVLTAKVISVVKTGTTTGTFTTDRPHGLATGDTITYFGNSNTAASAFPNLTAATAVTVIDATTFTAVIGTASTVTGYGGVIAKVQGGIVLQGANNNSAINATLTTLSDGRRNLILTGAASWSGLTIGDLVDAEGITNVTNGATLGVDTDYRVANVAAAVLTLEPANAAATAALPADFVLTTSGGAVIRRTEQRISFIRVYDYERERVEMFSRPSGDLSGAAPVNIQNTPAVTISGTPAVSLTGTTITGGQGAEDAAIAGNAVRTGGRVRTSHPATFVANDAADVTLTTGGQQVVKLGGVTEATWNANLGLTTTTAAALVAAGGAGLKQHITSLQAINTGAATVDLIILDGAAERWRMPLPVNVPVDVSFLAAHLVTSAATALNANLSAAGTVRICAQGYTAP
jgi:hypothetical protein